ncbi:MAG: hypothetical protein LE169_02860 [Endomicrobium sp.]|nr:hypothetical protein [Endomicrobium sp.]
MRQEKKPGPPLERIPFIGGYKKLEKKHNLQLHQRLHYVELYKRERGKHCRFELARSLPSSQTHQIKEGTKD